MKNTFKKKDNLSLLCFNGIITYFGSIFKNENLCIKNQNCSHFRMKREREFGETKMVIEGRERKVEKRKVKKICRQPFPIGKKSANQLLFFIGSNDTNFYV